MKNNYVLILIVGIFLFASIYGCSKDSNLVVGEPFSVKPKTCGGADVNLDGVVDGGDLTVFNESYGIKDCSESNGWCNRSDLNEDGEVGATDLELFRKNFGRDDCILDCKDSDEDYFINGSVVYLDEVYKDVCVDNFSVNEKSCELDKLVSFTFECPIGCVNGACISLNLSCNDSETRLSYYAQGVVVGNDRYGNEYLIVDFCELDEDGNETNVLQEAYCVGDEVEIERYECLDGCTKGACFDFEREPTQKIINITKKD